MTNRRTSHTLGTLIDTLLLLACGGVLLWLLLGAAAAAREAAAREAAAQETAEGPALQAPNPPESYYQRQLADVLGGKSHKLPDGTIVDVLTEDLAIECDFAGFKVYEAIGQSLWYSLKTGRKPAVYLILEEDEGERWVARARELCREHNVILFVRDVRPKP